MNSKEIRIGQVWRRKDGRLVEVTNKRHSRGHEEYELTPLGPGRKSWKWYGGIVFELQFISEEGQK